ncbi:MAG: hypothetical protein Q8P18_01410 [Pseudomonadota bacterium]|nr:hypothetical protein [Pseudomonadota bacterium]
MNMFINLGLPMVLNLQPEQVRITYEVAWMIVPFDVEVRQLRIRSQSPNDQLIIEVDRASATLDLTALVDRTFSAHTIEAHGASFRYRIREDAPVVVDPAAPIVVPPVVLPPPIAVVALPAPVAVPEPELPSRTPPIEGLQNPPVPRPEDIYPPPGDFWTVVLANVTVEGIREIWMEDYHFVGDARITTGEFRLQPTLFVSTKDTVLEIRDGQILTGEDPLLLGLRGKVTVGLDGLRPKEHPGRTVFGFLSAHATLDANVKNLGFLDYYLRKAPWLGIHGGAGAIHVDLSMENGAFQVGSLLTAGVDDIAARFLSYSVVGDGGVRFEVTTQADGAPESRLAVAFDDFAITRDGDATPHVEGKGFLVSARTDDVALDAPFTALDVVLEIPRSDVRDVGVFNAYLPRDIGLSLLGGTGSVHGRLEVSTVDNIGRGELFLAGKRLSARLDDLTIIGDLALHAVVPEGRLEEGHYDISGSRLELRNVSVSDRTGRRSGKDDSNGWWATIALPRGYAANGAAVFLDATLEVKLRDTVPFITIFAQKQAVPGFVRGMLDIKNVSGEARIRLGDTVLHLPTFEVRGGKNFLLSMQLRRKQLEYFGHLYVRFGVLSLGMELIGKKSRVHVIGARRWYEAQADVE